MTTRQYGSGSKRERRPGVWQLRVGGRTQTFHGTGKQAEKALAAMIAATPQRRSVPTAGALTVGDLLAQWRTTRQLEESTCDRYDAVLKHLPDRFAKLRLDRLTVRDFDHLYVELGRGGMSPQDVKKFHTAISSALTQAVRWRIIDHHPARGALLPKIRERQVTIPAEDALLALYAELNGDLIGEVWFRLALATGARRSEVLDLHWADVDLVAGTLTVDSSLTRKRKSKPTKTDSDRSLQLDADTIRILGRWRDEQRRRADDLGVGMVRNPFILSNSLDGSMPWAPNSASQRFRRMRERAGVGDVKLHDLRHANASMMLNDGIDPVTAAARLGHDRVTLLGKYAHAMKGGDQRAADGLGQRLRAIS